MIGQIISHYKILEKIGEGGMGVVYKAEDTRLHRTVALKFLPRGNFIARADNTRFAREAQAAATLNHPNIATIFEFDEFEDASSHTTEAFIAMEYVEGTTLQEIIKRGPASLELAGSVARQLVKALATAHRKNIIHRDLKPGNIVVTSDGTVKILDFGLAKLAGSATTKDGAMAGTISYMAPEQLQGAHIDRRADIWSFGVVVYELLTGKRPFRGEFEPSIMYSILNDQPEPITHFRPDTPKELVEIVDRCLKKDASQRAPSMDELGSILDTTVQDVPRKLAVLRRSGSSRIILALPGIAILGLLVWYGITNLFDTARPSLTLAVVLFHDETGDPLIASWPMQIQQYLSSQITGTDNIAVVYSEYFNDLVRSSFGGAVATDARLPGILRNEVTYLIMGTISKRGAVYPIHASLVQTKDGNQLQSFDAEVGGATGLGEATTHLAEQILAFLHTEVLQTGNDDLAIWKQRRPTNWKAIEEFSAAHDLILNDQDPSLRLAKAVELDSMFLSPRIWMIPALLRQRKYDEIRRHREFFERMKPKANSFESAMIDWVGAFEAGDYAQQARYLRVALLSSKNNRILLHNLAYAEYMRGNYGDALDALAPCLKTKWRYAPMYRVAGESLLKLGDLENAKRVLHEALANDWVDPRVYAMLTAVHELDAHKSFEFEEMALRAYRERNQPPGLAFERIAGYLADIGWLDSAEVIIARAIDENPAVASSHGLRGEILFLQRDLNKAREESTIALRIDSTYSKAYFLLGKISEQEGDSQGAIRYYRNYLRSDSTSATSDYARQQLRALQR